MAGSARPGWILSPIMRATVQDCTVPYVRCDVHDAINVEPGLSIFGELGSPFLRGRRNRRMAQTCQADIQDFDKSSGRVLQRLQSRDMCGWIKTHLSYIPTVGKVRYRLCVPSRRRIVGRGLGDHCQLAG